MPSLPAGRRAPYLLLALTCLLGWLFKAHCGAAWSGDEQYLTGCYSDAVPFWGLRGVAAGQVPYLEARMEYPVLTGGLIWLEGLVVRVIGGARGDAFDFLLVVSAVNAALAGVVLWMMEAAGVARWRLWAWAAAPALVLYVGHNWDMLAVSFAVAAVLAARRGAGVAATALAALGTAAKLFPVLLLPLLGLGALFARGRSWRQRVVQATRLVTIALLAWGAVNLPVALAAPVNWSEFYTFSQARDGTAAATWQVLADQGWWLTDLAQRNLYALVGFVAGAATIVTASWRRHGERAWLLFTPVLAWFLLTNKVWSPQFDLWLYPMLVLTSRRGWPIAWFALGDLLAYWAEFRWFASLDGHGFPVTTGHIAIAWGVRAAALLWIIAAAVREPAPDWITRPPAASPPRADRPTPAG